MEIKRTLRHLSISKRHVRKTLPAGAIARIEQAIAASELSHLGRVHFVVESALPWRALWRRQSARERALELFSQMQVWDTEHNNGILIYLLLADRALEIIADRGIHARVDPAEWAALAGSMTAAFGRRDFEAGLIAAVQSLHPHLIRHFPRPRHADHRSSSRQQEAS